MTCNIFQVAFINYEVQSVIMTFHKFKICFDMLTSSTNVPSTLSEWSSTRPLRTASTEFLGKRSISISLNDSLNGRDSVTIFPLTFLFILKIKNMDNISATSFQIQSIFSVIIRFNALLFFKYLISPGIWECPNLNAAVANAFVTRGSKSSSY